MTREELWQHYCAKNPSFSGNGNVTMSAAGLKKLFEQTWQFGFDSSKETIKSDSGSDLFNQLFKKR